MGRTLDWLAAGLLFGAACAVALAVFALDRGQDRHAVYWILVGGLALKSSSDLLGSRKSS
ncbi:MAG TPA: hypothetical protein VGL13_08135 [Polyangiaceae bacterium]|jgi:hypothetical protein